MKKSNLGSRIKIARSSLGITSENLAEACNISNTYMRKIESGSQIPSVAVFITICNELKVSADYLLQDFLDCNELDDLPELKELWKKASPKQSGMAISMIKEAMKHTNTN